MDPTLLVLFGFLFVMLAVGVPVGFAIGGATMLSLFFCTNQSLIIAGQYNYSGIFSFTVMAIPFFMLAGTAMSTGGIAKKIVNFVSSLVGFITGGLGAITILACMFFGALCGSGMATTAAIGGMMIPQMKDKGYKLPYAATLVCFGGTVGPIIPPSLSFVLYGATTKVPVPTLFLAGILPGILIGVGFLVTNYVMCRSMGQDLAIRTTAEKVNIMEAMRVRGKLVWKTFREGFWALLSPVIILGGIYSGIFTPTEAACISVVYSLFVSVFVYKELDMKGVYKTFLAASVINGVTSFLLGYSTVFSTFMTFERVPQAISEFLMTVTESPVVLLLIINAILLVVGCFLDTVPAIIVMAPMLLPTITHFGISPVHFGVIMAVNLAFGLCTPPYGCNLFVGAAVAKISMESMFKYIIPFFIVSIVVLMIITYVPAISLFFIN